MNELNIQEADKLEVTILMDNYTDMLLTESTDYAEDRRCLFLKFFLPNMDFRV